MNRRQAIKSLAALPLVGGLAGEAYSGQGLSLEATIEKLLDENPPVYFDEPIYSLRFADGCIFHDKIRRGEFHIDMNQQIIVEPLFWLEVEQICPKRDTTSHCEWESCKLANEHCVRGPGVYSVGEFAEVFLYKNQEKQSDDSWHLHKITWFGGEEARVSYLYGSTRL